jgi:two-component system, sporulation sensor kinase E
MQDQIRQLDKLAAIGRFTSSVAHEIRNPLAGIAAGIDYLRRDISLSSEQAEYIKIISQEIERLDRVIRNLFTVARPGFLLIRPCALAPVLARVVNLLAPTAAAKQVEICTEGHGDCGEVECDCDQIQQVLLNIVKNAVEAEAPGGTVRVTLEPGGYDAYEKRIVSGGSAGLVLRVENGGEAIAVEDMERIFEPFYTRKSDGTGLGLFVSYNIVKQHNGVIEVRSEEGGSTRFTLFLPYRQPRTAEAP